MVLMREQREDSDVDMVVEFEKGRATLENFLSLAEHLEKLLGRKVDLITEEGVRSIRVSIRKEIEILYMCRSDKFLKLATVFSPTRKACRTKNF